MALSARASGPRLLTLTRTVTNLPTAVTALPSRLVRVTLGGCREVTMKATVEAALTGEDSIKMQKLLDAIESLDDVQDVYTSAVMDEA